jgi:hypothetical protein
MHASAVQDDENHVFTRAFTCHFGSLEDPSRLESNSDTWRNPFPNAFTQLPSSLTRSRLDTTDNSSIRFCEASTETWLEIVKHSEDAAVRVALNKTIPLEAIEVLSKHESARVRRFAADKNAITPELILLLSTDSDPSVPLRITKRRARKSCKNFCTTIGNRLLKSHKKDWLHSNRKLKVRTSTRGCTLTHDRSHRCKRNNRHIYGYHRSRSGNAFPSRAR